jgi:hypothetical protein
MSIKTNLTVDQGSNFVYNIYLIDADGNPFNITGYTANAQIRRSFTSYSYTTVNTAITGASGLITLSMNAATTSNLTNTRYVYDLELKSSANVISRIVEGTVTVNLGVTK